MKKNIFIDFRFIFFLNIVLITKLNAANLGDVVINEIAWMGTAASSNHEWIELYNRTDQAIDLTGWTLTALDGSPDIQLEGIIQAQGYFLLERSDDGALSIVADQIYSGALGNSGESLQLKDELIQMIDQIDCSEGWFGGDNSAKASMERKHPSADGNVGENWGTNDGITYCGADKNGDPILGTPKSQNSIYDITLSVLLEDLNPTDFILMSSFPNPFNPDTVIRYQVKSHNYGNHKLRIHNCKGEIIREFYNPSDRRGVYEIIWDGRDSLGMDVSSGLYFCSLISENQVLNSIRLLKIK